MVSDRGFMHGPRMYGVGESKGGDLAYGNILTWVPS